MEGSSETAIMPEGYYQKIIESYAETLSVKKTAEETGVSRVKVQKVLITEGLWSSPTSRLIGKYYEKGCPADQIAEKIGTTVKNVQAYLPYSKGEYYPGKVGNALRCARYRSRKLSTTSQ